MDLIYQHNNPEEGAGSIWQSGYQEIPHDLNSVDIHLVIYAAAECPPLNHHLGADLQHHPNQDMMVPFNSEFYTALLENAKSAVPAVVSAVKEGKNVLVTCSQGINRSSLVTGLAIKELTDLKPWDIINLIKEKREGTLTNGTFMAMIVDD